MDCPHGNRRRQSPPALDSQNGLAWPVQSPDPGAAGAP